MLKDRKRGGINPSNFPGDDTLAPQQELQIHEEGLKIQNEELQQAKREAESSRNAYEELYDHAPVGYLKIDQHSIISQANLLASEAEFAFLAYST